MKKHLKTLIFCVLLGALAFAGSMLLEASKTQQETATYLSNWEEEIAKALLLQKDDQLLKKLLAHVGRANVRLVREASAQTCLGAFEVPLTLYGLPATSLEFCQPVWGLAQQAAVSPVFMGLLILALGLFSVFSRVASGIERQRERLAQKLALHEELSRVSRQVAHDIRSPLSALTMLAQLSHGPDEDSDRARLLSAAVGRIQAIADDLHERGKTSLAGETALKQLPQMAADLARELALLMPGQSLNIPLLSDSVAARSLPLRPEVWQRLLQNLLKNAFESQVQAGRFDPLELSIQVQGSSVRISLRDRGLGIDRSLLPRLGAEGVTAHKKNGTGLGLAFVQRTLASAGGALEIRNRDQGAEVTLICPCLRSRSQVLSQGTA